MRIPVPAQPREQQPQALAAAGAPKARIMGEPREPRARHPAGVREAGDGDGRAPPADRVLAVEPAGSADAPLLTQSEQVERAVADAQRASGHPEARDAAVREQRVASAAQAVSVVLSGQVSVGSDGGAEV